MPIFILLEIYGWYYPWNMQENIIHPTAVIDPKATLGSGNYIGPYCIIGPNVKIGSGNRLEAFASIGTPAEHRNYFFSPPGSVEIGNENVIREYVTINGGTSGATRLMNKCTLLKGSHVGHDAYLDNSCNLGCNAIVGGHTHLSIGANLGLSTVVHQNRVVGAYALIGMNSTVTRDVIPFSISFGTPSEVKRVNRIGLQRAGLNTNELVAFDDWFESQILNTNSLVKLEHKFEKYLIEFFKIKNDFSK